MEFWTRIQKDIGKSLQTIRDKAGELTVEGKRKYKVYDLQSQIHKLMAELGAAVYALKDSSKNPAKTPKATALIGKIARLEEKLAESDPLGQAKKPAKKTAKKKTTPKSPKKTATKKTEIKK